LRFAIAGLVPVVGQLDLRGFVAGRGQKDQRVAAGLDRVAAQFDQPQLVAIEIEAGIEIADPHHGMEIFHCRFPSLPAFAGDFIAFSAHAESCTSPRPYLATQRNDPVAGLVTHPARKGVAK